MGVTSPGGFHLLIKSTKVCMNDYNHQYMNDVIIEVKAWMSDYNSLSLHDVITYWCLELNVGVVDV